LVKKHTRDITTFLTLPKELQQEIRGEIKKGKSIRQVAKKLNVSRDSVIKYTRDLKKHWKNPGRTKEEINQIRKNVIKYKSRFKTAKIMNIPYSSVYGYTWDIDLKRGLAPEKVKKIRNEILKGKTKIQTADENNMSYSMVLKNTRDIPSRYHSAGWTGIRGTALEILQILIIRGFYICSRRDSKYYRILKKYFPMVCKVSIYGKTIIFLEDKSNDAIRGFLESINKRKIGFWELEKISKAFKSKLSKNDKLKFVCKF
jgi:hypothetical protein